MKRFFAFFLACLVLCLSVCADEVTSDPAPALDPAPVEDPAPAPDPSPAPAPDSVFVDDSSLDQDCCTSVVDSIPSVVDSSSVAVPDPVPVLDEVIADAPIETSSPVFSPVDPVVDVPAPSFTLDEVLSALRESFGSPDVVSEDVVLTGVSRVSVPPVTPSSTTGLKAALLTVLGNYDPVVVVYQYNISSSGYSSYATDIQPDYVWIASALLLCLVIWCLFKLGGALLRG